MPSQADTRVPSSASAGTDMAGQPAPICHPFAPDGPPIDPLAELEALFDELRRISRTASERLYARNGKDRSMHHIATRAEYAINHVRNLLRHHDTRFYPRPDPSAASPDSPEAQ